jgi:hypothetical protein
MEALYRSAPLEFRHGFAQNRRDVKNVGDAVTVQD